MTYEEFKSEILSMVEERLPENCSAKIQTVSKNNSVKYDGIMITTKGVNISPTIRLNYYYDLVQEGESMAWVVQAIIKNYEAVKVEEDFNLDSFIDYERAKNHIAFKLVNRAKNSELLKNIPNVEYLDLAIIFIFYIENESLGGNSSVTITNEHMNFWDKSVDELMACAMENTPKLLGFKLENICDVISRIQGNEALVNMLSEDRSVPFYVLSNEKNVYGAATMIYKDALKAIAGRFKSDLYVIPCSVHELIIMPAIDYMADFCDDLRNIIQYVNREEVSEMDVLSDNLYFYSKSQDALSIH